MKHTVYLVITRENVGFLDFLDGFVSFKHYDEREKLAYPDDVGKMEGYRCTFRFCYHNTVIFEQKDNKGQVMYYSNQKKPEIGKEIIFVYDDVYHIGYLMNDDGSEKPRKWTWYSYIKGYEVIEDLVETWFDLPNSQPERSKREDSTCFCHEVIDKVKKAHDEIFNEMLRCGALNSMET